MRPAKSRADLGGGGGGGAQLVLLFCKLLLFYQINLFHFLFTHFLYSRQKNILIAVDYSLLIINNVQ